VNARGIDCSHYNGSITNLLKQVDFVIAKASEGAFLDAKYGQFSAQTLKAGKVLGAYHFGTYGPGPTRQAQTFLSVAKNAAFLALDVEGPALRHPATMAGIIANLHKLDPQKRWVGLYASDGNWPGDLGQDFDWVANWSHEPNRPYRFWQTSGVKLDHDTYHGDVAHLQAWAKTRRS
jgi:GH25 family lysozyme M1 (1,4-beta-N-acetylmuramidase)